jgi:hypothetical protein
MAFQTTTPKSNLQNYLSQKKKKKKKSTKLSYTVICRLSLPVADLASWHAQVATRGYFPVVHLGMGPEKERVMRSLCHLSRSNNC